MSNNNLQAPTKFHPLLIALHWLMLLLIAAIYITMEFSDIFPKGSAERGLMKTTHFSLGISVLLLVVVRIAVRISTKVPPIIPAPNAMQDKLAKLMHLALYVFMIAMPLVGWLILSAHGKSVPFFGMTLPPLIPANEGLDDVLHELHEIGGNIGYFLIAAHAAAGLFHHYKLKDNTLLRMSFLKK